VAALVTALAVACAVPALAQQQTTVTKFTGTATATGVWTRTITDITEPNGPGGGTIQAVYNVNINITIGDTADQVAEAYRAACNATLPAPAGNPNGYSAVRLNTVQPRVRLSKQKGTYNYSDGYAFPNGGDVITAFPPPGLSIVTDLPANAEDAPITTPAGLAALAAGLTAVVWWARRRRVAA